MEDVKITKGEFSTLLRCSPATISTAISRGNLKNSLYTEGAGKDLVWKFAAIKEWLGSMERVTTKNIKIYERLKELVEEYELGDEETTADYKTQYEKFRALDMELRAKQREGSLVDKEKVNRELFEAGKLIRERVLNVPDSIIDDLLACTDRHEAREILYSRLSEALEAVADMGIGDVVMEEEEE